LTDKAESRTYAGEWRDNVHAAIISLRFAYETTDISGE
jgi:hypothetical protein